MTHTNPSIVIAGGGTAGHIEPALAVGEVLAEEHGATITALGTSKGLESDIIPARGLALRMITPVPIPRKLSPQLLAVPFKVLASLRETRAILKDVKADAVFGTGGYVAAPAYMAAKSLGIPFYVLETNALAGMANKLGVKLGGVGFNAQATSGMPGEVVGIPVRPGLGDDPKGEASRRARELWNLDPSRPVVLVTGGSQGAQSINKAAAGAIPELVDAGFQVLHAYGKKNEQPQAHEHYISVPYIDDMAAALAVADMVVCRSGAMTVAEVTSAALPAVYVPLPHGNGEQALNCRDVVEAGAAVMVDDAELSPSRLVSEVLNIIGDGGAADRMKAAAKDNATGGAAGVIAQKIVAGIK